MKPYLGLNVIDFSQGVAGPYCAMLLAQNGANVIKIEPKEGDWSRTLGDQYGDHSAFSVAANLGKKSIVIDLKNKESKSIVDKIISKADIFIEGFRPGVIERLGYGYNALKKKNKNLIYLSISGFGQNGPMSKKPAMDPIIQAFTGFMSENKGLDNYPHRTPVIIFDMMTALYATQAVASTLYSKKNKNNGKKIEISLMESAAAMQSIRLMGEYMDGPYEPASAPAGTFKTKDGWIQIIAVKNHEFIKFCNAVGWSKYTNDERFQTNAKRREHQNFLTKKIQTLFKTKITKYWQDILTEAGVQNEKVNTYTEFVNHEQTKAMDLISFITQPGSKVKWPIPKIPGMSKYNSNTNLSKSPSIGEHTKQVMKGLGYSGKEILDYYKKRVIG